MNLEEHRSKALQEMKRVLKKEGKIIIDSFSERSLPERLKAYKDAGVPVTKIEGGAVYFDESVGDNVSEQFTREELVDILEKEGLVIEDIFDAGIAYFATVSKKI
jgi:ubiquinone/menaquinone biosynthesis C-methylase UbiE